MVSALNEFEDDSKLSLSDYEYQSLAVHLIIAIKRIKNNEFLPLDYNNSGKIEKNTELLVQILEHHFMLKIPTVEKGYINIHILAIQGTQSTSNYSINEHKNEIFYSNRKIVDFLLENLNQYDKTLIQNLTLHLVPAMKRLSLGLSLRNPYATDTKKFFPIAYDEATSLGKNIKNEFNIDLNDDELAYIALHIEAFIERSNRRVSAVIVCSSGLGTASLIEQRISRIFSNSLVITRVTSLQQLKQSPITEDLVISTINIKIPSVPVVVVTPFLDSSSIKRVQEAINHVHNSCPNSTSFTAMIHRDLIFFDGQQRTTKDVIQFIGEKIQEKGFGESGLIESAIAREKLSSTVIDFVAVPHGDTKYVKTPCIAIYINPDGVVWNNSKVLVVFFLAMNSMIRPYKEKLFSYFDDLLEDQTLLKQLAELTEVDEVIHLLSHPIVRR